MRTYQHTSYNNAGWLGGDPTTGRNGNPGAYADYGAGYSYNSADAVLAYQPQASWAGAAFQQSQLQTVTGAENALQQGYNNTAWYADNLNSSTGVSYGAEMSDASVNWADLGACVGGIVTETAGLAATVVAPEVAPATVYGLIGGAIMTAGACAQVIINTPANGYGAASDGAYQNLMAGMADTFALTLDDLTGDGNRWPITNVAGGGGAVGGGVHITPGFAPPESVLRAVEPHMTKSAQALYFPHGLNG